MVASSSPSSRSISTTTSAVASSLSMFLLVLSSSLLGCGAQVLQNSGKSCRVLSMIPFTDARSVPTGIDGADPHREYYGHGEWANANALAKASFSLMASAELARRHFNDRDASIVPELASLQDNACDITMDEPLYLDSAYDRRVAIDRLMSVNGLQPGTLCAMIGPSELKSIVGISPVAQITNIPQLVYRSQDRRLHWREDFPNLVNLRSSATAFSDAIIQYLYRADTLKQSREYCAIVYDADAYGEQFEHALHEHEDLYHYRATKAHFEKGSLESYYETLGGIQTNGYRTILIITDRPSVLYTLARVADEMGLLGPGYLWVLIGETLPIDLVKDFEYEIDSPVDKLLRGAAVFTNFDPFVYDQGIQQDAGVAITADPFLKSWRNQDPALIEELNRMQPLSEDSAYVADSTYFEVETPTKYASFIYDSVIATGLSACHAQDSNSNVNASSPHMEQLLQTSFQGASGPVNFTFSDEEEHYKNYRNGKGILYGLYNIRPGEITVNGNMRGYEAVLTSVYSHDEAYTNDDGVEAGAWSNIEGTDFLYFDGTPNEPTPTRTVHDAHYLSTPIQVTGFVLTGLALFIAIGSALWVFVHRKSRLVTASQPEFLYLLCFGAALVAPSAFFVGFDEDKGLSQDQLSTLCSIFPWTFVLGFLIMYCAIFSKLWRLQKVLSMRQKRQVVEVWHVSVPFCIIIICSLTVLTVWQITSPLQWERKVISWDPLETYGQCNSQEHGIEPFLIPLGIIMFVTMLITAVLSWSLRGVQSDLSESHWIFAGIFVHIQTSVIGVPMLYITDSVSKDAFYLMVVALTFTFSSSLVALVIWPKIYAWAKRQQFCGFCIKDSKNKSVRIAVEGGRTRVTGLESTTATTPITSTTITRSPSAIMSQHTSEASFKVTDMMMSSSGTKMTTDMMSSSRTRMTTEQARIQELEELVEQLQEQLLTTPQPGAVALHSMVASAQAAEVETEVDV